MRTLLIIAGLLFAVAVAHAQSSVSIGGAVDGSGGAVGTDRPNTPNHVGPSSNTKFLCIPSKFASSSTEVSGGTCNNNDNDQGQIMITDLDGASSGAVIVAYEATEQNSGNGCDAGGIDAGLATMATNTGCTATDTPYFGCTGLGTGPFADGSWSTLAAADPDALGNPRVAILCNSTITLPHKRATMTLLAGSATLGAPFWNVHIYVAWEVIVGVSCANIEAVNSVTFGARPANGTQAIATGNISPTVGFPDALLVFLAANSGDPLGLNKGAGSYSPGALPAQWSLIESDHDKASTLDGGDYQFYIQIPSGGAAGSYNGNGQTYTTRNGSAIKDGAGIILDLKPNSAC